MDPFREMAQWSREMNHLLNEVPDQPASCGVFPPINLYDRGEALMLRSEIPGIDPSTLDIQATATSLTVKGERNPGEQPAGRSYHRRERDHGKFSRTLSLPTQINPDKVHATYRHGVLELILPKADEARARKISVN